MLINWNRVLILFLVLLTTKITQAKVADWIVNLIRFTRNELHAYQVVILFDQNKKNVIPNQESIHRIISRKLPTWKISFEEATAVKAENLSLHPSFSDLRATSLFLIIRTSNEPEDLSSLYDSFDFISNISSTRSRPNCLVVVPDEINYSVSDRFLRFWWSKQFIDVSILEFKFTQGKIQNSAALVSFDPFRNRTSRVLIARRNSPKAEWFLDKTRDLHGFSMKVGAFHEPPSSYLIFNNKGEIIDARGQDITLTRTIAKAMNFKIKWISSNESRWGTTSCVKNLTRGLVRGLVFNEINLVAMQGGRRGFCPVDLYEKSTATESDSLPMVVRIIPGVAVEFSTEWKLTNLGYFTAIFLATWFVGRLLNFDHQSWGILDILLITISFATPSNPQKLAERILFGALLIACLLYSYIYTAFTDVRLQKTTPMELKTIEDVASSPLQLVLDEEYYKQFIHYAEGNSLLLLKRARKLRVSHHGCLDLLVKNTSMVCIVKEKIAQLRIQQDRDGNNRPLMKIVDQRFQYGTMTLVLEKSSPFLSTINKVLRSSDAISEISM